MTFLTLGRHFNLYTGHPGLREYSQGPPGEPDQFDLLIYLLISYDLKPSKTNVAGTIPSLHLGVCRHVNMYRIPERHTSPHGWLSKYA